MILNYEVEAVTFCKIGDAKQWRFIESCRCWHCWRRWHEDMASCNGRFCLMDSDGKFCLFDDLNSTSPKISQIIYLPCWDYYYGDDDERKCYLAEVTEQLIAVQ